MGAFSLIVASYYIYRCLHNHGRCCECWNSRKYWKSCRKCWKCCRGAEQAESLTTTHTQQPSSVRRRLVRRRPLQAVDNMQSPTPSTSRVSNSPPPPPVKRPKTNSVNTTSHDDDDAADETIDDDEEY